GALAELGGPGLAVVARLSHAGAPRRRGRRGKPFPAGSTGNPGGQQRMTREGQQRRPDATLDAVSGERAPASSRWRASPARLLRLLVGLSVFGAGEACLVAARLGNSPWTVLSEGVAL